MIRDYARRNSARKKSKKKSSRAWLIILLLLIALVTGFINLHKYKYFFLNLTKNVLSKNISGVPPVNLDKKTTSPNQQPPTETAIKTIATPKFVFYNILPAKKTSGIKTEYELEIAAAKDFAAADRLKAELALLGFTASITPIHKHGTQEYLVSIGPYDNKDGANIDQQKLKQNKIKSSLKKMR